MTAKRSLHRAGHAQRPALALRCIMQNHAAKTRSPAFRAWALAAIAAIAAATVKCRTWAMATPFLVVLRCAALLCNFTLNHFSFATLNCIGISRNFFGRRMY